MTATEQPTQPTVGLQLSETALSGAFMATTDLALGAVQTSSGETQKASRNKVKEKKIFKNGGGGVLLVQLYSCSFLRLFDVKDHRDLPLALELCRAGSESFHLLSGVFTHFYLFTISHFLHAGICVIITLTLSDRTDGCRKHWLLLVTG